MAALLAWKHAAGGWAGGAGMDGRRDQAWMRWHVVAAGRATRARRRTTHSSARNNKRRRARGHQAQTDDSGAEPEQEQRVRRDVLVRR